MTSVMGLKRNIGVLSISADVQTSQAALRPTLAVLEHGTEWAKGPRLLNILAMSRCQSD